MCSKNPYIASAPRDVDDAVAAYGLALQEAGVLPEGADDGALDGRPNPFIQATCKVRTRDAHWCREVLSEGIGVCTRPLALKDHTHLQGLEPLVIHLLKSGCAFAPVCSTLTGGSLL